MYRFFTTVYIIVYAYRVRRFFLRSTAVREPWETRRADEKKVIAFELSETDDNPQQSHFSRSKRAL